MYRNFVVRILYGTKLIRTRLEPLRNKQVFIEHFSLKVIFLYYPIYLDFNYKSTFSVYIRWLITTSAVYSGALIWISARSSVTCL